MYFIRLDLNHLSDYSDPFHSDCSTHSHAGIQFDSLHFYLSWEY